MGKGNKMMAFRIGTKRYEAVLEAIKAIEYKAHAKAEAKYSRGESAVPDVSEFIRDAIDRRLKEMNRNKTRRRKAVMVAKGQARLTHRKRPDVVAAAYPVETMAYEGGPCAEEDTGEPRDVEAEIRAYMASDERWADVVADVVAADNRGAFDADVAELVEA